MVMAVIVGVQVLVLLLVLLLVPVVAIGEVVVVLVVIVVVLVLVVGVVGAAARQPPNTGSNQSHHDQDDSSKTPYHNAVMDLPRKRGCSWRKYGGPSMRFEVTPVSLKRLCACVLRLGNHRTAKRFYLQETSELNLQVRALSRLHPTSFIGC